MKGSLFTTALDPGQVWFRAGVPCAGLFDCSEARMVHGASTFLMAAGQLFKSDGPQLEPALLQRHRMLDALVEEFEGKYVLELAAGLSPRGSRFSSNEALHYVEVDLAPVLSVKRALMARTVEGQEVALRENLQFVAGDLRSMDLAELVPAGEPVLVIGEGLFMYLTAAEQRGLWQRIAALIAGRAGSRLAFDLVPACEQAPGGAAGRLLGKVMGAFTGGRGFALDDRTREDLCDDLQQCGFVLPRALAPRAAPESWRVPHLDLPPEQLLFLAEASP
jgi:O-methyltransferase involved in polyketide biosynthesis